jgi:hypothetical protein
MATEAQLAANRANAQGSTGPATEEGKARVSANAVKLGLFSSRGLVRPEETALFEEFRRDLMAELQPDSILEQSFANEILHAMWRLRRCLLAEEALAAESTNADSDADHTPIARARAHANATLRRSTAELRRLQTERQLRTEMGELPGLASRREIVSTLATDARRQLLTRKLGGLDRFESILAKADGKVANFREITKQTQSDSPAPCDTG